VLFPLSLVWIASETAQEGDTYDGVSFSAPQPPVPTLSETIEDKLTSIETSYRTDNTAPIDYMGTTFQADANSQSLIAAVLTASGGMLPLDFSWYDATNVPVPMTYAQLQGLAGTILMRGQPLFVHKQDLKVLARAATTIEEVEAITW